MSEATQLAAAAAHDDPEIGLAAVVALRQLLDQLEALQVASAREHGWTWQRIATALGVTLDRARDAVWLVVGSGRGDGPRFDSATLLATLGIDLDQIRRQVERQFGPNAIHRLYVSEVGWNLRPRGPLCDLPLAPNLKKAISDALGGCWENAPPALHPRLLTAALDTHSQGLTAVLHELGADGRELRAAAAAALKIAS